MSIKNRKRTVKTIQTILAVIVTLIMIFPLYWMVITSFKSTSELTLARPTFIPYSFSFDAYRKVLTNYPLFKYIGNTVLVTIAIVILQVGVGIFAAYSFAIGKYKGKNFFFLLVLGALMIPIQVTFLPIYVMASKAGLINSYLGLIIPEALSAYSIFMLRQSFLAVDKSYLEAAKMDGMTKIQSIVHVLVPMNSSTIITMTILAFINGWNSYFWPKMITTKDSVRTIALGIAEIRKSFLSMEVLNMNQIMAASVIAIIPVVILFLVFQKYILSGFSKAAMK